MVFYLIVYNKVQNKVCYPPWVGEAFGCSQKLKSQGKQEEEDQWQGVKFSQAILRCQPAKLPYRLASLSLIKFELKLHSLSDEPCSSRVSSTWHGLTSLNSSMTCRCWLHEFWFFIPIYRDSRTKSSVRLHFFRSIITTSIHVFFGLHVLLGGLSTSSLAQKSFSSTALLLVYVGCAQIISNKSGLIYLTY